MRKGFNNMINFDELNSYSDYSKISGPDIIEFMKTKPREEIETFKTYCSSTITARKEDGTTFEHKPSFFEIRNWVLNKYYPGLTTRKNRTIPHKFYDDIMAL